MIIYPDSCIYGRQRDDQTQPDINAETLAIDAIFGICLEVGHTIIGSKVVEDEILDNPNQLNRIATIEYFMRMAKPKKRVILTTADFRRARVFMAQGLREGDSYHLAAAESAGADVLLTVDKDFIRIATTKNLSNVRVLNPFKLLQEVTK